MALKIINELDHVIFFNQDLMKTCSYSFFEPKFWQQKNAILGKSYGRGTTTFFKYNNLDCILRNYKRGGLIAKFITNKYFYLGFKNTRVWKEYELLEYMYKLGLPVPKPIAGRVIKSGLLYQADIILETINNTVNLKEYLSENRLLKNDLVNIGKTIAMFHNNCIFHSDLNISNIMLDSDKKVWLVDFDKCKIKRKNKLWQLNNIRRLKRSFDKSLRVLENFYWLDSDWEILIKSYYDNLDK